ncbi:MAG: PAS domain S-box protein [Deltaproteobacteria bacterium]|nr:PAS domain S-box protein [Deltaproteobacteria bacterium]
MKTKHQIRVLQIGLSVGLFTLALGWAGWHSLQDQSQRLLWRATMMASLIDSVAAYDKVHSPNQPLISTLGQVRESLEKNQSLFERGFLYLVGDTPEGLRVYLAEVHGQLAPVGHLEGNSPFLAPLAQGLAGEKGVKLISVDGKLQVSAYAPIPTHRLVLLLGFPLWDRVAPFLWLELISLLAGGLAFWLGVWLPLRQARREAALRELEGRVGRLMTRSSSDGVVFINAQGLVQWINPAVETLFGYQPGELMGKNVTLLMPEEHARKHDEYLRRYLAGAPARVIGIGREVTGRRKDGSEFPLHLNISDLKDSEPGVRFAGVLRDLSEITTVEAQLRAAKNSLAKAQAIGHMGSWEWDIPSGGLTWTDEVFRIFGHEPQAFPATYPAFLEAIHPDDREKVTQGVGNAVEKDIPYRVEHRVVRPSGEIRTVLETGEVSRDAAGTPLRMVGTVQDITDLKAIQNELTTRAVQQSALKEILEKVMEGMPSQRLLEHGLSVLGYTLDMNFGHVFLADPKTGHLTPTAAMGWPLEHLPPLKPEDISRSFPSFAANNPTPIPLEGKTALPAHMTRARIQGGLCVILPGKTRPMGLLGVYTSQPREFSREDLHFAESMARMLATALDRERIGAQLEQSMAQLATVVTSAPIMLVAVNGNNQITLVRGRAAKELGFNPQEMEGKSFHEVFSGQPMLDRALNQARDLESETVEVDLGDNIFEVRVSPALEARGRKGGVITVWVEITERKKIERMKSEFIATVSHELRTPLTSIRGSLGLITGGVTGKLPEQTLAMLNIAYNNSERLVRLINDILDIEKIESGNLVFNHRPLDLHQVLVQAVESNQGYAREYGVILEKEIAENETWVMADPDRMIQVLSNLISNAVKFSPRGERVVVRQLVKGKKIRVEVEDHGAGIPKEFQPRVFSKFAQADSSDTRKKGGTGLGLSICRAIVERHGGVIGFSSGPQGGTVFHFELPVYQPLELAHTEENPDHDQVLVVEDNADDIRQVTEILNGLGFKAMVATSAEEAKNLLARYHFQGVLMDLSLPGENGLQLIHEIQQDTRTRHLPVVVLSAYIDSGVRKISGGLASVVDMVDKPFSPDRLVQALSKTGWAVGPHRPVILHVEDDKDVLDFVAATFGNSAEVLQAKTLAAARAILETRTVDLMIVDQQLPDGDGLDLTAHLPATQKHKLPVVVLSAFHLPQGAEERVSSVFMKYESDPGKLKQVVNNLLRKTQASLPEAPLHASTLNG